MQYASNVWWAHRLRATAEIQADVSRVNMEGPDAGNAARDRAAAEAAYQSAVVQAQADSLQTISDSPDATDQQKFDYLRAAAEADWISAVTPAFIVHAKLVTYPEVWARPLWLAMNPPPVEDDPSSWAIWTNTELTRQASDAHWEAYYANTATLSQLQRDLDHATAAALFGVNQAIADKAFGIANATTDKTYAVAQAGGVGSPNFELGTLNLELAAQHEAGLAANSSGHTLGIEDAKLGFQQQETNSRGGYSSALAAAQLARDVNLATNAKVTAITEAGYQASADQTFALAEENQWRGETTIDNAVAWAKAMADANLWSAEETANVSGTEFPRRSFEGARRVVAVYARRKDAADDSGQNKLDQQLRAELDELARPNRRQRRRISNRRDPAQRDPAQTNRSKRHIILCNAVTRV